MKSQIKILLTVLLVTTIMPYAYGWDNSGHATIGHIADRNLTPKARKICSRYLGHSLAYYASWMDRWRYSNEYHHTARWHSVGYKNGELMPSDLTGSKAYYATPRSMDDHGVARLKQMAAELRNYRKLSDSAVVVNLKCIIHIVGDLHCPGHTFLADTLQYGMKEGGKPIHFHNYIDGAYIRFNKGLSPQNFYSRECRLTKAEKRVLCEGDIEHWLRGNLPLFRECYALLPKGVDYNDIPQSNKLRLKEINDRLHRDAGYRLAHFINQIFK